MQLDKSSTHTHTSIHEKTATFADFVSRNAGIFLAIFIVNAIINIWALYVNWSFSGFRVERLMLNIVAIFLHTFAFEMLFFAIVFKFMREKARRFLTIFAIISLVLFLVETFLLTTYKQHITPFVVEAVLQTNKKEAFEFLQDFASFKFLLFCILIATIFLFMCKLKFTFSPKKIKLFAKVGTKLCIIGIFLFFCECAYSRYVLTFKPTISNTFEKVVFGTLDISQRKLALEQLSFFRLPIQILLFKTNSSYADLQETRKNYAQNVHIYKNKITAKNSPKRIVLVIGESHARGKMSLYGYRLPTTPRLEELEKNGSLVKFTDVIAPAGLTAQCLRVLLNFADMQMLERGEAWNKKLDLINLFNIAGFDTFVVSNQETFSESLLAVTATFEFAKNYTNLNRDVPSNIGQADTKERTDEKILPFIKFGEQKSLNVIHLMGQHIKYSNRYPEEFAKFDANDIVEVAGDKRNFFAHYLNAVYFGDFVLGEIWNKFKDEDAVMIYVGDHGESLMGISKKHLK